MEGFSTSWRFLDPATIEDSLKPFNNCWLIDYSSLLVLIYYYRWFLNALVNNQHSQAFVASTKLHFILLIKNFGGSIEDVRALKPKSRHKEMSFLRQVTHVTTSSFYLLIIAHFL